MQAQRKVVNFGKINSGLQLPNLIEMQVQSYEWFLQPNAAKRKSQGLQAVFEEVFPIESHDESVVLEFVEYEIGAPKYSELECKDRDATYAAPLKAVIRFIRKDTMEVREQSVYIGDIPLMTPRGTFIINGAERVVVNQLHRSPGIFFDFDETERLYSARVSPDRGSWLEFEMDPKGYVFVRIDRKKKFPATLLLRAIGFENDEDIVRHLYDIKKVKLLSDEDYEQLNGRRTASPVVNKETDEVIIETAERIGMDMIDRLKEEQIREIELIEFPNNKDDAYLRTTFEMEREFVKKLRRSSDDDESMRESDKAMLVIYESLRQESGSGMTNLANAAAELYRLFFNPNTFSMGAVGRYKIMNKFLFPEYEMASVDGLYRIETIYRTLDDKQKKSYDEFFTDGGRKNSEITVLMPEDIIHTFKYLLHLIAEASEYRYVHPSNPGVEIAVPVYTDDIDHLGNRRVRSVGELIMNQMKTGFQRMERVIKERLATYDIDQITPTQLVSVKPISAVINEFFGSSQLSQFMDQTNPLAELTHKRRLNALGPGGLSRERAGFEVRDVHPSHYGRMCPIETPEGPNIGLIVSLSTYARINEYGFLETPYRVVENGRVTDRIEYLTADREDHYFIAQANAEIDEQGNFIRSLLPCRYRGNFPYKKPKEIRYMDVSPNQIFSVSTCLIPFLEHDDANRALMGSNMQRQAVPLMVEEAPFIGTGLEAKAAYDSGVLVIADRAGEVEYVDATKIRVRSGNDTIEYPLMKYKRTNQGTCFNQRPIVRVGQKVKKGDILADGPATDNGKLALGKNILVAFMPWMGYNFEDAILISERLVMEDVFTSIHIEQFEVEARETKLGNEVITRDIPNLSEKAFRDLDADGIVRRGAYVRPDDILVGKVTPKGEQDLTPEYKLLHSIFGEKAREVRDTSLRVPNGVEGIVVDVKRFSLKNGDELAPGVEELVKVYIADKRKISVGDKMAGRHGNKGVISKIVPIYDMPYLPDGTPVDIVLNPLSVPSRMNLGQLLETELGWAAAVNNITYETPIFDGPKEEEIQEELRKAGLPVTSKTVLYDGRTGRPFEQEVMVGYIYMMKLAHMVDDKIHARSTGPYSLVTQQPLGGKAQFGGQRLGEMEVWALEAYGAAYTLQELLTVKSDDMLGRARIYEAIVKGINTAAPGIPESFNVLIQELRGLALDVKIFDDDGKEISLSEWSDGYTKPKKRIKIDSLKNI